MANIASYAKAGTLALALGGLTGQTPVLRQDPDGTVVVYWPPDKLPAVQDWLTRTANAPGGDFSLDFFPVIQPWLLKKYGLYALGALLLAYLIGKAT